MLVTQSCLTLCDPVDCSPSAALSMGWILQARTLEWVTVPSCRDLPDPGIEPTSPASAGGWVLSLLSHLGNPQKGDVGLNSQMLFHSRCPEMPRLS